MAYGRTKNLMMSAYGDVAKALFDMIVTAGWQEPWTTDGTTGTVNATPTVQVLAAATWTNNGLCGAAFSSTDGRQVAFQRAAGAGLGSSWVGLYSARAGFRDAWITFPARASITNGHTLIITDGDGHTVTFEWDTVGGRSTGGRTMLDVSAVTTAAQVAAVFVAAAGTTALAFSYVSTSTPTIYCVKTNRTGISSVTPSGSIAAAAYAPSGSNLPAAYADWQFIPNMGSGTLPALTYATAVLPTSGTILWNGVASDTAAPWFWLAGHTSGSGSLQRLFVFDRAANRPQYAWDDVVAGFATGSPVHAGWWMDRTATTNLRAWVGGPSQAGAAWCKVGGYGIGHYVLWGFVPGFVGTIPNDPWTSKDLPGVVMWQARPSELSGLPGPFGPVGESSIFQSPGLSRAPCDLQSYAATGDRVYLGTSGSATTTAAGWDNTTVTL